MSVGFGVGLSAVIVAMPVIVPFPMPRRWSDKNRRPIVDVRKIEPRASAVGWTRRRFLLVGSRVVNSAVRDEILESRSSSGPIVSGY